MAALEERDPLLVEELLLKKKWRNVQKDPLRALNDQSLDKSAYWQSLNSLPPQQVAKVVTGKVLKYDKDSCDTILQKILSLKQAEDGKRERQLRDRQVLRNRLIERHNTSLDLESHCGVRLGSVTDLH